MVTPSPGRTQVVPARSVAVAVPAGELVKVGKGVAERVEVWLVVGEG
jgi:hypothetical protein